MDILMLTEEVGEDDLNAVGNLYGGRLMEWFDKAASVLANKHLFDASEDKSKSVITMMTVHTQFDFVSTAQKGELINFNFEIIHVGNSAITVKCSARTKDRLVAEGYMVLVYTEGGGTKGLPKEVRDKLDISQMHASPEWKVAEKIKCRKTQPKKSGINRYRATAGVTWAFDMESTSEMNPTNFASQKLTKIFANSKIAVTKIAVTRIREQKVAWGEFKPEEVLDHITRGNTKRDYVANGVTYPVKMNSHRYFLFAANRFCVSCGLEGIKMILEQHPDSISAHFNLYGEEDGELVMLTKDHICSKKLGGRDRHSNYQTMCTICNNIKGSTKLTIEAVSQLRKVYNNYKDVMDKKELNDLIKDHKKKFVSPQQESNVEGEDDGIILVSDIGVVQTGSELIAFPIYDAMSKQNIQNQVACIQHGTRLHPVSIEGKNLLIPFNETTFKLNKGITDFKEIEG